MNYITMEQLQHTVPFLPKNADVFIPYLNTTMERYDITTRQRICMFIAQLAHESGGFRYTKEIANGKAYEGRTDLGNIHPGDGMKYKGRGLIQCTGRNNYMECSKELFGDINTLLVHPQLLETPQYACLSAGWVWNKMELNKYADLPDTWRSKKHGYSPFQYVTYLINGGQNGLADREAYYKRAKEIF